MRRRELSKILLAAATAVPNLTAARSRASTSALRGHAQTPQESNAGVTPRDTAYPPGDLRRYAADPTGRRDSTSALHQAISTGHSLYFCDGEFLTTGMLSPRSNTRWWGSGTLKSTADTDTLVTAADIENFTLAVSTDLSASTSGTKTAISIDGSRYVTVTDGRHVQGAIRIAPRRSCSHITIARNTLLSTSLGNNTSAAAISVNASSRDFSITDNEITGATGAGIGVFNSSHRGVISRNRCTSCVGSGIYVNSGHYLIIESNICTGNGQSGIGLNTSTADKFGYATYCSVVGNICAENLFDGIDYNVATDHARRGAFSTVTGNVLARNGSNHTGGTGIYLKGVDDASIVGNAMIGNNQPGIFLNGAEYCTITGNGVAMNGSGMRDGEGTGIQVAGEQNTIIGNTSSNHGGSAFQAYGIRESGRTGNCILGNTVSENKRSGLEISGKRSIVIANQDSDAARR